MGVFTPFSTLVMISFLDLSNSSLSVGVQIQVLHVGLVRSRKLFIVSPMAWAHATCSIRPNHLLASLRVVGSGNSAMSFRSDSLGLTPSTVTRKPANSTSSWQNWNFSSLKVIPLSPHNFK